MLPTKSHLYGCDAPSAASVVSLHHQVITLLLLVVQIRRGGYHSSLPETADVFIKIEFYRGH